MELHVRIAIFAGCAPRRSREIVQTLWLVPCELSKVKRFEFVCADSDGDKAATRAGLSMSFSY